MELARPESVTDAVSALGNGSVALGGGTDLIPLLRDRIVTADTLVELRRALFHPTSQVLVADLSGASGTSGTAKFTTDATFLPDLKIQQTRTSQLVEERRQAGKVRLCHGDLHLRNICLLDGVPTLFVGDAITIEPAPSF